MELWIILVRLMLFEFSLFDICVDGFVILMKYVLSFMIENEFYFIIKEKFE